MKTGFLTPHRHLVLPILVALGLAFPVKAQIADTQPLADIARAAEDFARGQLTDPAYSEAEVTAGALDTRLRLKLCDAPLESFSNGGNLRGGRLTVGVRCPGTAPWTLYVPVAVAAQTSIVLIEGPLARGTVLNASHLRLEQRALNALPPQYVTNLDEVVGRELGRAVNGSTIATPSMLNTRDLVAKGQDVTILANGSKIQVRMAGVALQKGQQGERIEVRNTTSGKTVQAVIVDGATVEVQL